MSRLLKTAAGTATIAVLAACTTSAASTITDRPARPAPPIAVPAVGGKGSIATTLPAAAQPTKLPAQAGPLAGQALPTNQWWSSALTGPRTQTIWAHPLAVKITADGLQISGGAPVTAAANAITTEFRPVLRVPGATGAVSVASYGEFHVVLRVALSGGGSVSATIVQGSPVLWLKFDGAPASVSGSFTQTGKADDRVRLDVSGQRWDVLGDGLKAGADVTASGGRIALARVPDGVDTKAWEKASTADPVVSTSSSMTYTAGSVTQTLTAKHADGASGVWALLPHQQTRKPAFAGSYPDARGPLSLATGESVRVTVPMAGLLTGVPKVTLPAAAEKAVIAGLDQDLADPPGAGGSYFGLKELGRLATIAETAQAVGATAQRKAALDRLRPQLVDWLTYTGPSDDRYFGYDRSWGGLVAVPAEFGAQDYNDHHFQYAYLVRAAAVLAKAEPAFAQDYGGVVDAIVRDFAGGGTGMPPFRVFNAYLGSSAASGFAPFADGNNQESSSEAVASWEAVVRWAAVRGDDDLTAFGVTHYALEAATTRMYWLGVGRKRPAGYAHTGAGIVWDAKIDFSTWFDAKPESILGIQLLPLTFGSLYRAGVPARAAELGHQPVAWGDLFAADLAVTDPAAARRMLAANPPREESTCRGLVRYFIEAMAVLGPPEPSTAAPVGSMTFRTARVTAP